MMKSELTIYVDACSIWKTLRGCVKFHAVIYALTGSCVSKEGFETIIHVLLKVAMKQCKTRLIGTEIDDRPAVVRNDDRVLDHARGFFPVDLHQLPEMAVHVHRMSVVGTIPHDQPIARALL